MKVSQLIANGLIDLEEITRIALVTGLNPDIRFQRKVCQNTDISTGTVPEDLWAGGGLYTGFPTDAVTPEVFSIFSSSALDTAAGTGARTLRIVGLDASYNEIEEVVTLSGTTAVDTVNTYRRLVRAQVLTSGGTPLNNAFNAGTITIRYKTTVAFVFAVVPIGFNNSRAGNFTVPAGYQAILLGSRFDMDRTAAGSILGDFYYRPFGGSPRLIRPFVCSNNSPFADVLQGGVLLLEKSDIIPRVRTASANGMNVYCTYEVILFR